jgi:hypothetical protein
MGRTKTDVATQASRLVGGAAISSFTDDTTLEAKAANALYEPLVRGEMTAYDWSFLLAYHTLSKDATDPTTVWDSAFDIPAEFLLLRAVLVETLSIPYEVFGSQIFCDATSEDTVVGKGIVRVDEDLWPDYFALGITYRLAANFGGALARDGALVTVMEQKAEFQFRRARKMDASSDTTKSFRTQRLLATRS